MVIPNFFKINLKLKGIYRFLLNLVIMVFKNREGGD